MEISINGNDTITINGALLTKFADKDYGLLNFPDKLTTTTIGKSGNAVIAYTPKGKKCELTLRLLLATTDDATINSYLQQLSQDAPSFPLLTGQIVKRSGDGSGTVRNVIYKLEGGTPDQIPESHSNSDGDEEQGIAVWKFTFAKGSRQLM